MTAKSKTLVVEPVARNQASITTDETVDVTIRKLKLVGALKAAGINVDVTRVITDGTMEETIEGSPTLVVTILDRGYEALSSGVFGQKVDITLDGVPLRLVEVDLTDVEMLQLTFEHKLVNLLREHKSAIKASRSTVTRAQFIEMMLREVATADFPITYVCPEVNVQQPVAGGKATGRSLTSKTLGGTTIRNVRGSGFGVTHLNIRTWDGAMVTLGPSQLRNAAIVLQVCKQLNAPPKAVQAVMAACSVEPDKPYGNPPVQPGSGGSAGILQWGGGGQQLPSWANDVAQAVTHSLQDPGATGGGGMISLARRNPGWTPGMIAQREQGSAFPGRYDQALAGANTVINAFGGAGGFVATGVNFGTTTTTSTAYEFSRGQPGQPEDSWTCMQRLAKEVNWRCFVAGRHTLYFVTDDDLLKAAATYKIGPNTVGINRFTFQVETGGRTVRVHRHREPKPSEAQIEARFDRWLAPAGAVIDVEGYGIGDGQWLAVDIQRPLFDRSGTITIRSPQKPFSEPAPTTTTSTSFNATGTAAGGGVVPGSGGPVDRVYAAAQAMDRRNLPYIWGGGHTGSWGSAAQAGGYDCSGAVSMVLHDGGLMNNYGAPIVSGEFSGWGQPGRGAQLTVWYTGGHVFIEFYGRPAKRFDTVPGGSGGNGPHLRFNAPGSPGDTWEGFGFAPRHFPGL